LLAFFGLLKHKTQAGIVALVLDASQASSSTLEAHASGLAQADAIERLIRPGGERLHQHRIQVLSQPADACGFRKGMQGIFGKSILLPQRTKGGGPFLSLGTRKRTCRLPRRIGSHLPQSTLPFGEDSIIELPACFQMSAEACSLALVD